VSSSATYTVTATNTGGSATTTITMIVNDAPPTALSYGVTYTHAHQERHHDNAHADCKRRHDHVLVRVTCTPCWTYI
jgi:uncharacterized repeat protein (TIGR01451 family)